MPVSVRNCGAACLLSAILAVCSLGLGAAELQGYLEVVKHYDWESLSPCNLAAFAFLLIGSIVLVAASSVASLMMLRSAAAKISLKWTPLLIGASAFAFLASILYLVLNAVATVANDSYNGPTYYIVLSDVFHYHGVRGAPVGVLVLPCLVGSLLCSVALILFRKRSRNIVTFADNLSPLAYESSGRMSHDLERPSSTKPSSPALQGQHQGLHDLETGIHPSASPITMVNPLISSGPSATTDRNIHLTSMEVTEGDKNSLAPPTGVQHSFHPPSQRTTPRSSSVTREEVQAPLRNPLLG